jgi:hypothetical protein
MANRAWSTCEENTAYAADESTKDFITSGLAERETALFQRLLTNY